MRGNVESVGQRARERERAPRAALVRRKGHIEPALLGLLIVVCCIPLIMALARVLALPGADVPPGGEWLRDLGRVLNQSFTLRWVTVDDRPTILYLLALPTGALLVAVARLTLGLRVLGLRAILIAIGFQEIGFVASFGLMIVVVGAIVALRPSMRRIRLPLYARLPVVLCVVATIMVGALLLGPWARSEAVFNVAFFPTIIMAMMAEGIAKTLANDDAVAAAWRAASTIVLAIILALIGKTQVVASLALQFPELLVTELVAIVLIAEFLDLRLLEHWPARLSRLLAGARDWYREKPRVAVVRNRSRSGAIGRLGPPAPRKYRKQSVQPLVDALREQGFAVRVLEGDHLLARELQEFLPANPRTGGPGGIVLNLATGVQGVGRFCHVPALLEMLGVAYTGPDPVTHARLSDRYALLSTLYHARIRVPRCTRVSDANLAGRFAFPVSVRPRCEPDVESVLVRDDAALEAAVRDVLATHGQDAFIEEIVEGREVWAALFGNDEIVTLPLLEQSASDRRGPLRARLDDEQATAVRDCAHKAYRALGCRDYARVDVRLKPSGELVVVDVKWASLLHPQGAFGRAAQIAGFTFAEVVARIVEAASQRYVLPAFPRASVREPPPFAARERIFEEPTVEGSP
jgi:D-alanine-D-alanine ligase